MSGRVQLGMQNRVARRAEVLRGWAAAARLLRLAVGNRLLDAAIRAATGTALLRRPVQLAAIDSSGFESHRASNYFVRRRAPYGKQTGIWQVTTYRRFPIWRPCVGRRRDIRRTPAQTA